MKSTYFLLPLSLFLCIGCSQKTFRIIDKPIVWNKERRLLSIDYLKNRHGITTDSATINPKIVVLHWTAIPSLEASYDAMNPPTLRNTRKDLTNASILNVSSHFLIDRDGTIFRQLPDTAFARHVIGLNYCAIGIENVGSNKAKLTKAQLKANEQLIRYLQKKYPIEYVIGHYEYNDFRKHPLWKETDTTYRTEKTDPGKRFMKRIRKHIKDLHINAVPIYK
ncbi:peptidoglycan recognition family protein [Olivibacter ginsenosidimutans]